MGSDVIPGDWRQAHIERLDGDQLGIIKAFKVEDDTIKTPREAIEGGLIKSMARLGIIEHQCRGRWGYVRLTLYGAQLFDYVTATRRWELFLMALDQHIPADKAKREIDAIYPPPYGTMRRFAKP